MLPQEVQILNQPARFMFCTILRNVSYITRFNYITRFILVLTVYTLITGTAVMHMELKQRNRKLVSDQCCDNNTPDNLQTSS